MAISTFDLFKIGIGPSSSHTVGPMRAAGLFLQAIASGNSITGVARIQVELFGSLGATGKGHGTDKAVILGLQGEAPETVDTDNVSADLKDGVLELRLPKKEAPTPRKIAVNVGQ